MMLAIEASSGDPSLAIMADGGALLGGEGWRSAHLQPGDLLPRLMGLLQRSGRRLDQVSIVAVGLGPGSFTGLRVGLGLAKGLALGLGCRLVGIPSLVAWLASEPDAVAAMSRAGASQAYLLMRHDPAPRIVGREVVAGFVEGGPLVAPSELASAFGLSGSRPPLRAAEALARLAAERLIGMPDGDDLARLEPIYLMPPRGLPADPPPTAR